MDNQLSNVTQQYLDEYYRILDNMIQEMTNVNSTNSISHNFILQIIPLFEAAMDMSSNLLNYTTNMTLENLAINIITTSSQSIQALVNALNRCSTTLNQNTDLLNYQRAYNHIIDEMFQNMTNAPINNNININFLNEMIPLQSGALNMGRNALRFDLCTELIPIIQEIDKNASIYIQQMRTLLATSDNA